MKDIRDFLKKAEAMDYYEILVRAEEACAAAERRSHDYARSLKAFLFFMRTGAKPAGVPGEEFSLYRPVCEALVSRGQFEASVLNLFD